MKSSSMRPSKLLPVIAALLLLGLTSAFSTINPNTFSRVSPFEPAKALANGDKMYLRSLKSTEIDDSQQEQEERASLSFFNKIPGVSSLRAAAAARKATAQLKRAEEAALKAKMVDMFTITGTRDHEVYPKFAQWYAQKFTPSQAEDFMREFKMKEDVIKNLVTRYRDWRFTKNGI